MPGSGNKVVAGDFHRLRTTVRAGPDSTIPEVIRRKFVSNLFAHAGTIHPAGLLVKEFFGKSSQKFGSPQIPQFPDVLPAFPRAGYNRDKAADLFRIRRNLPPLREQAYNPPAAGASNQ